MKLKLLFNFCAFLFYISVLSQVTIEMKRIDGILQIPCKVNGIPMNFIFDTGATDVSISITEAKFLIKQGLLTEKDFIGKVNYQIANGDIVEGTQVYLKTIDIGGILLKNIRASIMHQQNSPLLFGQSAITKLGEYSIVGNNLIIPNGNSNTNSETKISSSTKKNNNTKDAIDFLNLFLNQENWMVSVNGSFTYNSYSNSLAYKSKRVVKNENKTIIENEYVLSLDNVKNIEEIIHKADKNKIGDSNVIFYEMNLINDIYYKKYTQEKDDVLPNYKNSSVNKISINMEKSLTEQDLENIQRVIRDIFFNIPIETKNL